MSLWQRWFGRKPAASRTPPRTGPQLRPVLEQLEERTVPTVLYHGGDVLRHVQVEGVFLGSDWASNPSLRQQATQLGGFLNYLTQGPYLGLLGRAGYGVGRGHYAGGIIDSEHLSGVVSDGQIEAGLERAVELGALPRPGRERLYFIFVQPGVEVLTSFGNSARDFDGYHESFRGRGGHFVNYAVVAYPGAVNGLEPGLTAFQQQTETSSHELAEAVTDPHPDPGFHSRGWFDGLFADRHPGSGDGEIGDIVAHQDVYLNGYVVQEEAGKNDRARAPAGATALPPDSPSPVAPSSLDQPSRPAAPADPGL